MGLEFSRQYTSDLRYEQWKRISPLIPVAKKGGRPRTTGMLPVLNAIFYRVRNGCQWRDLPRDFPPWRTVYDYFYQWSLDGTIEMIHAELRKLVRKKAGKMETPTAGIIDSQSVKTSQKGGRVAMMQARR